ncbi:MAG: hypothetical protein EXS00_03680 [Phycisphaerales bacterium]|nr:hypothetical protein [Phycisphaerales bacterium]
MRTTLAYLEFLRISNLLSVATNVLAGYAIALALAQLPPDSSALIDTEAGARMAGAVGTMQHWPFLGALMSVCCLYLAGMALNGLLDESTDTQERPLRPLPSGRISRRGGWITFVVLATLGLWIPTGGQVPIPGLVAVIVGIVLLNARLVRTAPLFVGLARGWTIVGVAAIAWTLIEAPADSAVQGFGERWGQICSTAIFIMLLLYNWLHIEASWTVGLLGACRACAFIMGAVALCGDTGGRSASFPGEFILIVALPAAAIFAYTIALSTSARDEVRRVTPSASPGLHRWLIALMLVAALLSFLWLGLPSRVAESTVESRILWISVALGMAVALTALLVVSVGRAAKLVRSHPARTTAGIGMLIAAFSLYDAVICVASGALGYGLVCSGAWLLTRWGQRRISGS